MSTADRSQTGLNILCIDGGGVRGLSALVLLDEIMRRIQRLEGLASPPEPYKYFNLIAGSGTGAIQACMLGRLQMPVRSAIESYETLAREVFSERKWAGSRSFKTTRLKESLQKLVQRVKGDPDEPMLETSQEAQSQCKTVVYAMSSHTVRSNIPIAFRSYPADGLEGPACTIWETLCAAMAHPALFKPFTIDGPPKWSFTGADLGCNNPLRYVLTEVKKVHKHQHVATVLSLGTGHIDTIQVPDTYWIRQSLPTAAIAAMRSIAANTEAVAQEIARQLSSTQGMYFRLNVDQGMQSVGIEKWEQMTEVAAHTRAYMGLVEIDQVIDQAANAIVAREMKAPTEHIDGTVHVSDPRDGGPTKITDGTCPAPTPGYTGREDMIEVAQSCILGQDSAEQIVCVMYGLGGAGKTQLALRVVERTRGHWADVIYIDASNQDSIEAGLQGVSVARKTGDTFEHALRWLESHPGPWLLVMDNADDPSLPLRGYLPSGGHGSIIITTRLYGMTALAQGPNSTCNVSSMNKEDALALLLKAARKQDQELSSEETESAKEIVEDVGHFALAIVHAGAFIGQSQHMKFSSYRSMLRDKKRQALEAYSRLPPAVKVNKYGHTVYTTWMMCYEKLRPNAKELLWLIGYMHHSGITIDIFRRAAVGVGSYKPKLPTTVLEDSALARIRTFLSSFIDSSGSWDDYAFTEVINEISLHSLLEYDHNLGSYRIHVLVQGWACTVVPHPGNLAVQCTRIMLSIAVPYDNDMVSISFRHSVGLHVDKAHSEPAEEGSLSHAEGFCRVFMERGQATKAEPLRQRLYEASKKTQGAGHHDTLEYMLQLASTYWKLGRYEEERMLEAEVVEARKRLLGDRHADTLTSMNNLALTYSHLGQLEDARALQVQHE
ncbi:Calcium-independent phospholipase A2-gamma [Rhizoctonia solani AG-1 IB]|uniref:Calcium-independent phospholipase A2-gamma n=1 Tax=Thanatephorus cucumeris (strain AG1-IB / isolate 7/3/14) TaxID=1108050 RepID=M5C9B2_THACB|nr:Calcium-independent phospholipase A2-gamma [Rhizoctonia solani AG-1 IB]